MSENNKPELPLTEIVQRMGVLPQYVLVIVAEKEGDKERVIHCDLREYRDALAIYDGITQSQQAR